VAEGGLERERERDLIEAGLNEPLPRPSNGRDSRPVIFDDRQAQTHAQLVRYGTDVAKWGSRFVDRMYCQCVRRGRKVIVTTRTREAR